MLWRNENVFVMDNHLAAAWCWLQSCDIKSKYNFMHIDTHYDMLDCFHDKDLELIKNNPQISFDDFVQLKRTDGNEVFRWDNFIQAMYILYPDWFHTNIFLTHQEGDISSSWGHKPFKPIEENPLYMAFFINQYIGEPSECLSVFKDTDHKLKWIVSFDIDVFCSREASKVQLYSDDYIRYIAKSLNDNIDNIQSLTIALSPDCIFGEDMKEKWDNAFRCLKIMSEKIKLLQSFPFPASEH